MIDKNTQRLQQCFALALGLSPEQITDELAYRSINEWDSVGHMALVAEIETAFDIMLDTEDILAMNNVAMIKQILNKLGTEF